jgi:GT2 family glycosyltransferase
MEENQENQAPARVSALIVSHNNAGSLRRTLAAFGPAPENDTLEIILVDNGSSDDCSRMDSEVPGIQMLRLPRNFGRVKALNIAMRTAKGEFLLFLEPGTEITRKAIAELDARLEAAPDAVAVCPLVVSPSGETQTRLHPLPLPAEFHQAWRDGDFTGWSAPAGDAEFVEIECLKPPVFLARSYFLKGLRYIDERYGQHWWDLEICTQILRPSKKILLVPAIRCVAHPGPPLRLRPGAQAELAADRALGAAVWIAKHYGAVQGWKFRLRLVAAALLRALSGTVLFREAGFRWALLGGIVGGQKVDGSQRAF